MTGHRAVNLDDFSSWKVNCRKVQRLELEKSGKVTHMLHTSTLRAVCLGMDTVSEKSGIYRGLSRLDLCVWLYQLATVSYSTKSKVIYLTVPRL